ncbi:MAG TPA: hypothetical protein VFY67_11425, partial [Pyrinomonadaceae bacterium]|nr:hypothetical protein [Pyrinomonadaceae bacterium]
TIASTKICLTFITPSPTYPQITEIHSVDGLTLLFNIFVAMLSPAVEGPRHHKPGKKQVAMIAQKVIDANQTHRQGRPFIASSNPRTTTLGTLLSKDSRHAR